MDEAEFEWGCSNKMLSESLFGDKIIHIEISDDDLTNRTFYDYLSHYFVLKITYTLTFISYH